jgi:phosphoribosylcarboxyaminoimidazole (NCAIR) mutase
LLACEILALGDPALARKVEAYREWQTTRVLGDSLE